MTQHQYLGADLTPVITASTAEEFNVAVVNALMQVAANDAPARIEALADLIAKRNPDLVGLQEVFSFDCSDPHETSACTDSAIERAFNDHLELTLAALNGPYKRAAIVDNLNVAGIPFDPYGSGVPAFLTVLDRDVILKRLDVETNIADYSGVCVKPSADGCNYQYVLGPISTPYGDFNVERGYVGVDVTIGGEDYRFVNTHLEVKDPPVPPELQAAQAQELIAALLATTPLKRSLVVVGDMNSSPMDPLGSPYDQYLSYGFTDVWTMRPGEVPGLTCCQLEDLSNHESLLYDRVDLVLALEPPEKIKQV